MSEPRHIPWSVFSKVFRERWNQGEHVFINGQTGSGKTELGFRLMEMRKYGVTMVTKPRDPIFKSDLAKGYTVMEKFEPKPYQRKILLRGRTGDSARQQVGNQYETFAHALDSIYADGGWTINIDETLWIGNRLRLKNEIGDIAFMGRALGLTGIYATQRPAHIPVIIPQSATHAFLGKMGRKSDQATVAELGGDPNEIKAATDSLRSIHDFVYVDTASELPIVIVNTQH